MNPRLANLLAGSSITPESHPALVALLAIAAQGPGLEKGEERDRVAPRIARQWKAHIVPAFRSLENNGVTDEIVKTLAPSFAFEWTGTAWDLPGSTPLEYRPHIAAFLNHVVNCVAAKKLLATVGL